MREEQTRTAVRNQTSSCEIFRTLAIAYQPATTEFHLYAEAAEEADATAREMMAKPEKSFVAYFPKKHMAIASTWYVKKFFDSIIRAA